MPNYSDIAFTSALRYEYVVLKGDISFSMASNAVDTFTITHDLGYIPFFRLWYSFGGAVFPMFSGDSSYNIGGNDCQVDSITATTTVISVEMENDGLSTASGNIYYRIYGESGD